MFRVGKNTAPIGVKRWGILSTYYDWIVDKIKQYGVCKRTENPGKCQVGYCLKCIIIANFAKPLSPRRVSQVVRNILGANIFLKDKTGEGGAVLWDSLASGLWDTQ